MSTESPIRFAVIGCGMLARGTHIPNLAAMPEATLQVCCDLDQTALAECQTKHGALCITTDMEAALTDDHVDAICLATTEKLRLPVIARAAELGKPVYVEKPLARSLEEMAEIQRVVKQSGIPFCVGHNRRASPAMRYAVEVFHQHMANPRSCGWRYNREGDERPDIEADGTPGISVRINDDWYSWKKWVFDPQQAPHGPMLFEMTHFTDICNWFMQDEPMEVVALEFGMLNTGVVIRYAKGGMATINLCASGTFGYPKELYEVMGHGGLVAVDHMVEVRTAGIPGVEPSRVFPLAVDHFPQVGKEGGLSGWLAKRRAACEAAERAGDPMLQFGVEPDKGHAMSLKHFIAEIRGSGQPVCGVDSAVSATQVAFAAIHAARLKRAVTLDEIRQGTLPA